MELAEELRELEGRLLEPSVRKDAEQLFLLLADDFLEIGSSGRCFDKTQTLAALCAEPVRAGLELTDFAARPLAPHIVLVTYRTSQQDGRHMRQVLRSSIWVRRSGRWQVQFHQGTRMESPERAEVANFTDRITE